ncbi:MAG TPA: biotin transporter BioY [Dehalococcoidia bacterium]|jgi:biotin transporter BioY|nr:biotin transporter BioY [Dehalococcoidia bacterium]|tara:strand:- start:2077 stop:2667 length:591 start_codon:yes stop_codon:yes gene_type:complete
MNLNNNHLVLVDWMIPRYSPSIDFLKNAILVIIFSLIVSLSAQIRINLGFTPVPITAQTFVVLLTGALLGSKRGASVMILYIIEGAFLPVFSNGGSGLIWQLSTGGYILGFIPAAYMIGKLIELGWAQKPWILPSLILSNALIYIPGLAVLSFWVPEGTTFEYGLFPFILGDLIKIILVAIVIPLTYNQVNKMHKG